MNELIAPGTLLLSAPDLQDPNFMHTVVLLLDHSEDGALGLIINRRMGQEVREVFPDHSLLRSVDLRLCEGGPVGTDTMQILHRGFRSQGAGPEGAHSEVPTMGMHVRSGIHVGGDLDEIANALESVEAPDEEVRFVVGYSGWGKSQLEAEIMTHSWLPLPATPDLIFSSGDAESVWRAAVGRLGGGGSSLAHLPPDTSWN